MTKKWWQETVVYQVYPKSFMDGNGDGVGDLKGITEKLDYLQELGINVVWLSPINRSPMRDNGYDIADYYEIDPVFGTNKDLEILVQQAKERNMKVLMDLVVNHVSDQHEWFLDVRKNPESKYRDYFIIRSTESGEVPNNFRSYFGGSVWEQIPGTKEFYFHAFAKEQPDLNWECKELRQEIMDMMSFWHEKGISGFRIDAIGNIKKSKEILSECRMEPDAEDGLIDCSSYLLNQPGIGTFLSEMRDQVFQKYDSMTVAEVDVPYRDLEEYIGENGYFSMVFDFSYADIDTKGITRPCDFAAWDLSDFRECVFKSQEEVQQIGWAAPYLENHDQPRSLDKYLPDGDINYYSTTMLGALYFFLRGTPYIYQGQEIGMSNFPFTEMEQFDDIGAKTKYETARMLGDSEEKIMDFLRRRSRDNARTPMQWDDTSCAGFTKGTPWLQENPNYKECNVKKQQQAEKSVLKFYQDMIRLRRESEYKDTLVYGCFEGIRTENAKDFMYRRVLNSQEVLIVMNYSNEARPLFRDISSYEILLNNYETAEKEVLEPYQVLVLGK